MMFDIVFRIQSTNKLYKTKEFFKRQYGTQFKRQIALKLRFLYCRCWFHELWRLWEVRLLASLRGMTWESCWRGGSWNWFERNPCCCCLVTPQGRGCVCSPCRRKARFSHVFGFTSNLLTVLPSYSFALYRHLELYITSAVGCRKIKRIGTYATESW